ncbi:hypothetical protein [Mycobacterium sp. PSTR-4-N]|uniref:hypothetical protein n=1 Tax=Mycobacterium sp. PSTR-4-N TaxID=2917745 RepID=UPI001F14D752|nr:hypothetical protein [Mycobacterium sp. PSTR-4-N]MCG7592437.1 hypothetical protein [Mycobacterium sp. PSTR-4-N]
MTALDVEFVDELPGRSPTPSADIAAFADALRAQPGRWARYPWSDDIAERTRKSRAYDINRGQATAPAALRRGFQAAYRNGTLWVRCIATTSPAHGTAGAGPAGESVGADLDPASPPPAGHPDDVLLGDDQ